MKLAATHLIDAPRPAVFAALTDPAVLQNCIGGCERMVKTSEDTYEAQLKLGLAGLQGKYSGKVQLKDLRPPEGYTLIIEGKGVPGFVHATARIALSEKGDQTELVCDSDARVGGMIAGIGSRLTEAAGKRLMEDFLKRFAAYMQQSRQAAPGPGNG